MSSKGKRFVLKENGKWEEGKASPELLREDLRKLPGDMVTKEEYDGDRIHAEDPPHIQQALKYERAKLEGRIDVPETATSALEKSEAERDKVKSHTAPALAKIPIRGQDEVDAVRMRVIHTILSDAINNIKRHGITPKWDDLWSVKHLWFPDNNINKYELRPGCPPAPSDMPKHMRNLDVVIDVQNLPPRINLKLLEMGIKLPDTKQMVNMMKLAPIMREPELIQ